MADSGRLDELKRKFDENPRRYFAPLANEYRKAGDTERAIELCRSYLPQQPGHMSGYIVYGQALFDAGRFDDAHEVFKQALSIDPENIIALRHLGDIARQGSDRAGAMQWYGKVLELDPKNEEIASYITGLAAPEQRQAAAARPAVRPEPEPSADAVALEALVQEPDAPRAREPMRPAWEQSVERAVEQSPERSADLATESVLETPPEPELPSVEDVGATPWAPAFATPFETGTDPENAHDVGESQTPFERFSGVGHETQGDEDASAILPIESAPPESPVFEGVTWQDEDVDPAPPHELVPDAMPDEPHIWMEPAPAEPAWPASEWGAPAPGIEPAVDFPVHPADTEVSGAHEHPESPFVTETMAELYWQQGFTAEALAVYRRLTATRADPRLFQRMRELEAMLASAPSAPAPEREREPEAEESFERAATSGAMVAEPTLATGTASAATEVPTAPTGPTVREFFAHIGTRKPSSSPSSSEPSPTETAPQAPARTDSLSALFDRSALDERDVRAAASLGGAFTRDA